MRLLRRSRTKAQVSSDEPTLTIEQSLHSIAVELHRMNAIQEQQLRLLAAAQTNPQGLAVIEKLIEPLSAMIAGQADRPTEVRVESLLKPKDDAPTIIRAESEGMRVEQTPED